MLLSQIVLALLPLAVVAAPTTTKPVTTTSVTTSSKPAATASLISVINGIFCSVEDAIISTLKKDSTATSFCSSYLSISTKTFTATSTVTPTPVTTTTTLIAPATTSVTTTIVTATVLTTTTITATTTSSATLTSTTTATCLSAAYQAPVAIKRAIRKRASVSQPSAIPTTWAKNLISSACSCLNIPTPSSTVTTTTTLTPSTVTSTVTTTPTSTSIVTSTTTVTSVGASTTVTDTETATTTVTATALAANGVKYRKYTDKDNADIYQPNFNAAELQGTSPDHSGSIPDVELSTRSGAYGSYTLQLADGYASDGYQAAVVMQGYFVASQTGTYTISTSANTVDNWNSLWAGNTAYTWQDGTEAYEASRTGTSSSRFVGGTYSFSMNAGDAIPMTFLFANGGGPGTSSYVVSTPDGSSYGSLADFLTQPCDGSPFV